MNFCPKLEHSLVFCPHARTLACTVPCPPLPHSCHLAWDPDLGLPPWVTFYSRRQGHLLFGCALMLVSAMVSGGTWLPFQTSYTRIPLSEDRRQGNSPACVGVRIRGSLESAWEHDPHDTVIHESSSEDEQQHVSGYFFGRASMRPEIFQL